MKQMSRRGQRRSDSPTAAGGSRTASAADVTVTDTGGIPSDPVGAVDPTEPADGDDRRSLVGALVDRYRVLAKIGAGGMGVVYAALDPALDRKVALKVLPPVAGHRGAHLEARLRREAQALARLDHPNVVRVYDVG